MSDWLDKAKQAAQSAKDAAMNAAEKAKQAAQNANIGEMLDKTKNMAMQAAEDAKNAAGSVMSKKPDPSAVPSDPQSEAVNMNRSDIDPQDCTMNKQLYDECNERFIKIEALLREVKDLLSKHC
jgi:hypothetical protein